MLDLKGIGKIVCDNASSLYYDIDRVQSELIDDENKVFDIVNSFLANKQVDSISFVCCKLRLAKKLFSFEDVKFFETKGINITAYTKDTNLGGYALDFFDSRFDKEQTIISDFDLDHTYLRISKISDAYNFNVFTEKNVFYDDTLDNYTFENIVTNTQVFSLCKKNEEGVFRWSAPFLLPDGRHGQPPLTTTDQYAQSCFEGITAMTSDNGDLVIVRPWDNAKRMGISCESICIPPVSESIFMEAIKMVVTSNKNYLPKSGSKNKLYIRPYIKGLEGGYGVGPAEVYAFCIQIFPFGEYIGKRDTELDLLLLEGKKRSHDGGMGSFKVSGNYAQTILDRQKAKKGLLEKYNGKVFNGTMYLGELKTTETINGKEVTTVKEVLDEDSGGNVFFIKQIDGETTIMTPPLSRNSFLGGFTRRTVIELCERMGYKVQEVELSVEEIKNMDGSFLTGSAVGMSMIKYISYAGETFTYFKSKELQEVYFNLYDTFYNVRLDKRGTYPTELERLVHLISF